MPIRSAAGCPAADARSANSRWTASPARVAASELGKTASPPSPRNLTTVPPRSGIALLVTVWKSSTSFIAASSSRLESSVNPTMSANQTAASRLIAVLFLSIYSSASPRRSSRRPLPSVVVAGLEKLDAVIEDFVDDSVGLIDPARPYVATKMLEWLGFADANEGITQYRVHQVEHPKGGLPFDFHPVAQILQALVLERCLAPRPRLGAQRSSSRPSSRRRAARSVVLVRPRRARVSAASSRTAFCGDRSR